MKKAIKIILSVSCILMLCACTGGKKEEETVPVISGKTYYDTVDEYGNNEHSKVWFGTDGSFVLKDNFFEGWYEMNGDWSVSENVVTLNVKSTGYGQFTKVLFEIKDPETLILKTSLAGSQSDHIFSTTEVKGSGNSSGGGGNTENNNQSGFTYKTYYNMFQETKNKSYVEIRSDGSFALLDMNDFGVEEINGTYTESNGILHLKSDNHAEIQFDVYDDHGLILMTDNLGVSKYGDLFSDNNTIPDSLSGLADTGSTWVHSPMQDINDMYLPKIEFDAAGRFVFTENVLAGMAQLKGWYESNDSGFVCHVDDASMMQGFKGDDLKLIQFEKQDDKTLVLKTEICMSMAGDTFILK